MNFYDLLNQEITIEKKGKSKGELELTFHAEVLIHSVMDTCREDPECYKKATIRIKSALKSTDEWVS